jgi:gliding motility-associated-like protein
MEVTIYNRWGQFIWKSQPGYPIPWDGKYNGNDLPLDGYHYTIDLHNGAKVIAGSITIVR